MFDQKALNFKVGIFVTATITIFFVFVFMLGGDKSFFHKKYTLITSFTNTAGLIEGATVRLSGVRIGNVKKIEFPTDIDVNYIKVVMEVNEEGMERIGLDSLATIQTEGLLGDKYVEIVRGEGEPPVELPDELEIEGYSPPQFQKLIGQSGELIENVVKISRSLDKIVKAFGTEENIKNVNITIESLSRSAVAIERNLKAIEDNPGILHRIIYGKKDKSGKGFDKNTLDKIDDALRGLNALLSEISQGKGILHTLIYDDELTNDFDLTITNIKSASEQFAGEDGIAMELKETVINLRRISEMLSGGEGTLGALLIDPTLYDNLKGVLGQADRSRFVRAAVRYLIEEQAKSNPD